MIIACVLIAVIVLYIIKITCLVASQCRSLLLYEEFLNFWGHFSSVLLSEVRWSSEHTPAGRWAALFPSWAAGQRVSPSITASLEVQAACAPTAAPVELTLPGDGSSGRPDAQGRGMWLITRAVNPDPQGSNRPALPPAAVGVCVSPWSRRPGGNGVWY